MKDKNVLCCKMRTVKRYQIIERKVTLRCKKILKIEIEGFLLGEKDIDSVNIRTDPGAALRLGKIHAFDQISGPQPFWCQGPVLL